MMAHLGEYDSNYIRPAVSELFWLTRKTCQIWEELALGSMVIAEPVETRLPKYRASADAFWSKWERPES